MFIEKSYHRERPFSCRLWFHDRVGTTRETAALSGNVSDNKVLCGPFSASSENILKQKHKVSLQLSAIAFENKTFDYGQS